MLEHQLEKERLDKSIMKIELDTLTSLMNTYNRNNTNPEFNINMLLNEREYLTKKIYKIQVYVYIIIYTI